MPTQYAVEMILQDGFGFGDETKPSIRQLRGSVSPDLYAVIENLLATNHILAPVDRLDDGRVVSDDGCGDGRGVIRVFQGATQRKRSLNRAKVFGGGVTMALAAEIGLAHVSGMTLAQAFGHAIDLLERHEVDFGAHTDNHSGDGKSGCGAIDNAPLVLQNVVRYREQIKQTIMSLGLDMQEADIDAVLDAYTAYAVSIEGQPYNGEAIVTEIQQHGKVVKELDGDHKEMFVLLNTVSGMSADQGLVRDITGGTIQLFTVDVWRLQELDASIAQDAERTKAFIGQLVYTLGVAATLTHGDLPVYIASPAQVLEPAA